MSNLPHRHVEKEATSTGCFFLILFALLLLWLYRPGACTFHGNHKGISTTKVSLLRDFVLEDLNQNHPHQQIGFEIRSADGNSACVEVHLGADLHLQRTPSTSVQGGHSELWAMRYFWGGWHKVGMRRIRD
jgi:hypothetical protein